jgi:hypothetical protein
MLRSLILSALLMIAEATAASGIQLFEIESFGGRHFFWWRRVRFGEDSVRSFLGLRGMS